MSTMSAMPIWANQVKIVKKQKSIVQKLKSIFKKAASKITWYDEDGKVYKRV